MAKMPELGELQLVFNPGVLVSSSYVIAVSLVPINPTCGGGFADVQIPDQSESQPGSPYG